jgi:hypothetical protein
MTSATHVRGLDWSLEQISQFAEKYEKHQYFSILLCIFFWEGQPVLGVSLFGYRDENEQVSHVYRNSISTGNGWLVNDNVCIIFFSYSASSSPKYSVVTANNGVKRITDGGQNSFVIPKYPFKGYLICDRRRCGSNPVR